ncbi:MAG: hypothetical protein RLZZ450_7426 [Pseudomonadota bacterium]|jgi:hypothetical protein
MQYLATLAPENKTSLETMNRALSAWVEGEYHHAPHRGLSDESPADKWARTSDGVRMPDAGVGEHFLAEQKRRVQKDRTITLEGVAFEVDAALVGERVILRYDAGRPRDKWVVEVWHQGRRVEIARRVDVLANCFAERNANTRAIQFPKPAVDYEVPEGLSMRELVDPSYDVDDESLF